MYVLLPSAKDQNNTIVGKYEIIPTRIGINYVQRDFRK
jgi:hypothetical protein